jgi:AcrR family transcriptional regulator
MPRRPEQWAELRSAARSKIVQGALAVFQRDGARGASMDAVAREAGVSKGLAYNYFSSKEELVAAAVESWLQELFGLWARVESEPDPREALAGLVDSYCELLARYPGRFRFYFDVFLDLDYVAAIEQAGRESPELQRQIEQVRNASTSLFRRLGATDPASEVQFFRLLTAGLAAEYLMSQGALSLPMTKQRILAIYGLGGRDRTSD